MDMHTPQSQADVALDAPVAALPDHLAPVVIVEPVTPDEQRSPRLGVVAATAGATFAAALVAWLWSRWDQAAVDQRTRERLTKRRPAATTVPSAAEIQIGVG